MWWIGLSCNSKEESYVALAVLVKRKRSPSFVKKELLNGIIWESVNRECSVFLYDES